MNIPEFPAYNITFLNEKQEKPVVIFVSTDNNFSKGFLNNWTAFLFSLIQNSYAIEPHFVNFVNDDLSVARNIVLKNNEESKFDQLFGGAWKYDYIFWIDGNLEFFNPYEIYRFIGLMKMYNNIDIITHANNDKDNLDLKFTVFKKGIFENLEYPWFSENNKLDTTFNKKLAEFKYNIISIDSCIVE